jgi:hypothetical protein
VDLCATGVACAFRGLVWVVFVCLSTSLWKLLGKMRGARHFVGIAWFVNLRRGYRLGFGYSGEHGALVLLIS